MNRSKGGPFAEFVSSKGAHACISPTHLVKSCTCLVRISRGRGESLPPLRGLATTREPGLDPGICIQFQGLKCSLELLVVLLIALPAELN